MPFKSKAQQGYINAAAARGEVPQKVADEFNAASKGQKNLPEHVKPKKKAKKAAHKGPSSLDEMRANYKAKFGGSK